MRASSKMLDARAGIRRDKRWIDGLVVWCCGGMRSGQWTRMGCRVEGWLVGEMAEVLARFQTPGFRLLVIIRLPLVAFEQNSWDCRWSSTGQARRAAANPNPDHRWMDGPTSSRHRSERCLLPAAGSSLGCARAFSAWQALAGSVSHLQNRR